MAPSSESFGPADRLLERRDYLACYERGRSVRGPLLTVHALPNALGRPRLGVTASRKVGNAVTRNRLRRRTREVYRRWGHRGELPAIDIVVTFRPRAAAADFAETRRALEVELTKLLPRSSG